MREYDDDRKRRLQHVVEDCLRRLNAGETVQVDRFIEEHRDLMPELGEKLRAVKAVQSARRRAGSAGNRDNAAETAESEKGDASQASEMASTGLDATASAKREARDADKSPAVTIEGYDIVRELSHGGQGVVYQAIEKATKRKVAIKVLLEGPYASDAARRRFEREIELVASLKHPNIVAIYHSGLTPDGRQFCAMDYVRGVSLMRYVREQKLPLEAALKLFGTVCDAVQYAHNKGVIHRDLKPANIVVDVDGNPKVLDFGLAKQVGGPEQTLVSVTGQVVGTLPYLSPEQARGNPDEIDTRTDVYALGVILYELLTGGYPYPVVGQMADVLKHIAETEPTPPSREWKRESGINQRSDRRLRVGQCPIDGELQTIALMALSKERDRRYQSARGLARDLQHYLAGEAIEARRDSFGYVLRKQLKRYRAAVVIGTAFVLVRRQPVPRTPRLVGRHVSRRPARRPAHPRATPMRRPRAAGSLPVTPAGPVQSLPNFVSLLCERHGTHGVLQYGWPAALAFAGAPRTTMP